MLLIINTAALTVVLQVKTFLTLSFGSTVHVALDFSPYRSRASSFQTFKFC